MSSVIPVIDIAPYRNRDPAGMQHVADQIARAGEEIGFFSIAGHGVDQQIIDQCWQATIDYFDEPAEEKKLITMTPDYPYGYSPLSNESLSKGLGKGEAMPDLNESFCIGPYNPDAGMPPVKAPVNPPHVRLAWDAYYKSLESLALDMLRIFALALKMPEDFFDPCVTRHRNALRFLNYPAQNVPLLPGQVRAGEHTDYGSLTILLQDGTGGLQVKDRRGEWHHAAHIPGTFLINIGDLMQRWTNDRWVSTLHRVVNPVGQEEITTKRRQSIAYFQNINPDYNVSCIPTCTSATNPPKYEDILAWDHLMQKHLASVGQ
jgi:isopenicillin N synthase-like dioxygenase